MSEVSSVGLIRTGVIVDVTRCYGVVYDGSDPILILKTSVSSDILF